jgi:hypothetical protein
VLLCVSHVSKRYISACCNIDFCCVVATVGWSIKTRQVPILVDSSRQNADTHGKDPILTSRVSVMHTLMTVVNYASAPSPPRLGA